MLDLPDELLSWIWTRGRWSNTPCEGTQSDDPSTSRAERGVVICILGHTDSTSTSTTLCHLANLRSTSFLVD